MSIPFDDEKQAYADEKRGEGISVSAAHPKEVEQYLADKDHELAVTTEGEHGTKRALVSTVVQGPVAENGDCLWHIRPKWHIHPNGVLTLSDVAAVVSTHKSPLFLGQC